MTEMTEESLYAYTKSASVHDIAAEDEMVSYLITQRAIALASLCPTVSLSSGCHQQRGWLQQQ